MRKFIIIILFAVISFSCEDIDVIESQGWYEEKIVVYAELKANEKFEGVRFTRTLPVDEEYSIAKAELKDVKAYLKENGIKIIPLHYEAEGMYKPINTILFSSGNVYELFAEYDGKEVYAKTIIPHPAAVSNAFFASENFLEASVLTNNDEVYGALWVIDIGETDTSASDFYEVLNVKSEIPASIKIRTEIIPPEYKDYQSGTYIKVISFDPSYREYFQTRNNNQPINDSFSQPGAPVKWNVRGDGVIGLFMGIAESNLVKARY